MSEPQETETKEGEFEEFAARALRLHRKGSFESLLAQHLITSVPSDPLLKVRLILEAAYMIPADKLKTDINLVETIYTIALGFLNTSTPREYIYFAWPFISSDENFTRYIKPWYRIGSALSFCASVPVEEKEKEQRLAEAKGDAEKFFLFTNQLGLHASSLQILKSQFLLWAIPIVMDIFEELSRLVDPDLYKEMLQLLHSEVKPK